MYPLYVTLREGDLFLVDIPMSSLWHGRLGHLSKAGITHLSKAGYILKLSFSDHQFCKHCQYGKLVAASHPTSAFLNRLIHAFCDSILLRTIWCRIFTSNAAFPVKFDKFVRFELTSIVSSETFQLPTGLVFDHCEPIDEDREHPIFCFDRVSPHLPSRVINKAENF